MSKQSFDKKQWEELGAIVDCGGGARYFGTLPQGTLQTDVARLVQSGVVDLSPCLQLSYFEFPQLGPQGLHGVQRSADMCGVMLALSPVRVVARPVSIVHVQWLDDQARGVFLQLAENAYAHMQQARLAVGSGLVLPGPGAGLPPGLGKNGGRS